MSLPRYQPVDLKPKEDRVGENDYEQVDAPRKSRFTWKRLLVVLALAAVATFVAVAATAAPPKSPAPVVPEIYPTQSPPKVDKRPEV